RAEPLSVATLHCGESETGSILKEFLLRRCARAVQSQAGRSQMCLLPIDEQHPIGVVGLTKLHFDDLRLLGTNGAADIASLNGQFAMAPVDQCKQLHSCRTAQGK